VLLAAALVAAHFGGRLAGAVALRRRWSFSIANAVLAAAIGIPYLIALTTLLLSFQAPRGSPLVGFAILPILLYARLRLKKVLHPELKFFQEPPRKR
jgi:hypothetical protein